MYYDESTKAGNNLFVSPQNFVTANDSTFFESGKVKLENILTPDFEVYGVLNSSISESVIIISSTDSPKKRIIGLNEEIVPGTTLIEINQNYILIEKNGRQEKVEVAEKKKYPVNNFSPNFQSSPDMQTPFKNDPKTN